MLSIQDTMGFIERESEREPSMKKESEFNNWCDIRMFYN